MPPGSKPSWNDPQEVASTGDIRQDARNYLTGMWPKFKDDTVDHLVSLGHTKKSAGQALVRLAKDEEISEATGDKGDGSEAAIVYLKNQPQPTG